MSRYTNLTPIIQDSNGKPITGAKTYFYETGTVTLKNVYSDADFSTPIANPVLTSAGGILPEIFLDGIYKVVQTDENDVSIYPSLDPVGDAVTGNFSVWLTDSTYNTPEAVYASDDNYYYSLVDANQGNEPSASPTEWQLIPVKDMASTESDTFNTPTIESATFTGTQTGFIGDVTGDLTGDLLDAETVYINGAAGTNRFLYYQTAGVTRFRAYASADAESGGDVGSDYKIGAHDDSGALILTAMTITRSTGQASFSDLEPATVGASISGLSAGAIGTYVFADCDADRIFGSTVGGGVLFPTSAAQQIVADGLSFNTVFNKGSTLSGTWRCMGTFDNSNTQSGTTMYGATLWLRIS